MISTVKKGMQKKRHTKPCKFFQVDSCPLSAEVCDFAHVKAVSAISQLPPPCRYYLAGNCNSGSSCRYRHGEEAGGDSGPRLNITDDEPALSPTTHQGISTALQHDSAPVERSSMFTSYSAPYYHPVWPPYGTPHAMYGHQLQVPAMSPSEFHSRDSVSSGSSSVSPSDLDESYIMTEDPQYAEHSHQHQSRIRVYEEQQSLQIAFPSIDYTRAKTGSIPDPASKSPVSPSSVSGVPPRKHSRHSSKNKAAKYKTKPCKFYSTPKGCPAGDECTFIHGEADRILLLNIGQSPVEGGGYLPTKPLSPREESIKKNFFPIPWRVIGGGVLISSKKDQQYSRSRDRESSLDELTGEGVNTAGASFDRRAVPPSTVPFPILTEPGEARKPSGRMRASSIPPTPSSAHVKVDALFSAESPGVL